MTILHDAFGAGATADERARIDLCNADPTAIGAALLGVAVVRGIVNAGLAIGTWETSNTPAETRPVDANAATVGAAVVGIAVVGGIVDATLPIRTGEARDSTAERGRALALAFNSHARGSGRASVPIGLPVATADGSVFLGTGLGLRRADTELIGAGAVAWPARVAVLTVTTLQIAWPRADAHEH